MSLFGADSTSDPYGTGLMGGEYNLGNPNMWNPGSSSQAVLGMGNDMDYVQLAQQRAQQLQGGPQSGAATIGQIGSGNVANALWAQQQGTAASPAALQLQAGTDAAIAAQRSAAASSRLGTAGDAQKAAATNMAAAQQAGSMNAAQLRAQESQAATQQLSGLAGQQAGFQQQTNLANQASNLQQQQISNQDVMNYQNLLQQNEIANSQANQSYNNMMANQYTAGMQGAVQTAGQTLQATTQSDAADMGFIGSLFGGIGSMVGSLSDKNAKTDIKDSSDVTGFLNALAASENHPIPKGRGMGNPMGGAMFSGLQKESQQLMNNVANGNNSTVGNTPNFVNTQPLGPAPQFQPGQANDYSSINPDPHKGMISNFFDMVAQKQQIDANNAAVIKKDTPSLAVVVPTSTGTEAPVSFGGSDASSLPADSGEAIGAGKNGGGLNHFLGTLEPKDFKYKGSEEPQTGVIAQNLQKSEVGRRMVKPSPRGLVIDGNSSLNPILAGLGNLHQRLSQLEKRKAA